MFSLKKEHANIDRSIKATPSNLANLLEGVAHAAFANITAEVSPLLLAAVNQDLAIL
jgi:hypothetical protein